MEIITKIWKSEKLLPEITVDTETTVAPFHTYDHKLVLFQATDSNGIVYLVRNEDVKRFFRRNSEARFIFHNAVFDLDILLPYIGQSYIYELIDNKQIFCTKLLYKLYTLATIGVADKRASLKGIVKDFYKIDLEKGQERVTFGQYLGKPIEEISEDHIKYAALDVLYTHRVYCDLMSKIYPLDDMKTLLSYDTQIKGDYALNRIYKNGLGFDLDRAGNWLEDANSKLFKMQETLSTYGWVRGAPGVNERFDKILELEGIASKLPTTETGKISKAGDDLSKFINNPFIKTYLDFVSLEKASQFLRNIDTDVVHGRFNPLLNTGRVSCIHEDELVEVVGGKKPIKDIKKGDLVYSYNSESKLEIKPVLNVYKQGKKPLLKVKWRAIGSNKKGSLICTPDHKIKCRGEHGNPFFKDTLKREGWYRADQLVKGDRMFHMTRSISSGRQRIFSKDLDGIQEQLVIKEQIFNCTDHKKYHIHHKDHNKINNSLDNLEVIEAKEHARHHGTGRENPLKGAKLVSYSWEEMYLKYKEWYLGNRCPKEYERIKGICTRHKIKLRDISRNFKNNKEITLEMLIKSAKMTSREAEKYTGLDFRTWKKALNFYDICINHVVEDIEYIEEGMTYDIEVKDNHNFIASEICVHNCSNPNIQQLPRVGGIRECFVPKSPDNVFIDCDYSAIELVALSEVTRHFFGYSHMGDLINSGKDLHIATATAVYNKEVEEVTKEERQFAKIPNFGLGANMAPSTFVDYCKPMGININEDEAHSIKQAWLNKYPEVVDFFELPKKFMINAREYRHVTLTGRVRNNATYTAFLNTHFQGLAADGFKLALYDCTKLGMHIVIALHDQIVIESPKEKAKELQTLLESTMISGMEKVIKNTKVTVESKITSEFNK